MILSEIYQKIAPQKVLVRCAKVYFSYFFYFGAQRCPKRASRAPKGAKSAQKGAQMEPQGTKNHLKVMPKKPEA